MDRPFLISRVRFLGPVAVVAAVAFASAPAYAQTAVPASTSTACSNLHFELANPSPGSMLSPGGYMLEGIAMDARATSGVGIDRVDFFLGNRDEGGLSIGSAVPMTVQGPLGAGSFQAIVQLPDEIGGHDLFGYAHSTITGQEAIVEVPISVGEDPIVAGETSASGAVPTLTTSCTAAPTGVAPGATTPSTTTPSTTTPNTTTPSTTAPSTSTSLSIDIANPEPHATLLQGAYSIEGVAMHADRVDIFWDNRDDGGLFLGSAVPSQTANGVFHIVVDLPQNQTGPHSLWFYAHSSTSDTVTAVEIPVTVE
jgi:hypothetical protein